MVLQLGPRYAEHFTALHSAEPDFDYMTFYASRMLCDRLLGDGYHALDIGCGTCGSYRLMPGCKSIAGVDINEHMIEKAAEFCAEYSIEFQGHAGPIETFKPQRNYNYIRLGAYGHYLPHSDDVFARLSSMMAPGALMLVSFTRGTRYDDIRSSLSWLKRYETPRIRRERLVEMLGRVGFDPVLDIQREARRHKGGHVRVRKREAISR